MLRRHSEESIAVAIFKICKSLIFGWGCVTSGFKFKGVGANNSSVAVILGEDYSIWQ
jgi:hypothetical protein